MSNEIVKVNQAMNLPDIMKMAEVFAASGMFTDAKAMGQAFVKIQAGQEIGIPPFAAMSGIHIIQGKPTIGAGLIASTVKGSGKYDYRTVELTDKICVLDFYQGTQKIGTSTFTVEDAKKAGTKNLDKFPKNMLFARAISNGVKWFCPDVFSGPVYVPEEMQQLNETIDTSHEIVEQKQPVIENPVLPVKKPKTLSDSIFKTAIDKLNTLDLTPLTRLSTYELTEAQRSEIVSICEYVKETHASSLQESDINLLTLFITI